MYLEDLNRPTADCRKYFYICRGSAKGANSFYKNFHLVANIDLRSLLTQKNKFWFGKVVINKFIVLPTDCFLLFMVTNFCAKQCIKNFTDKVGFFYNAVARKPSVFQMFLGRRETLDWEQWVKVLTKWAVKYYKVGQFLLHSGAGITKRRNFYYKFS